MICQELDNIVGELKDIATVDRLEDRSVISLIGNAQMSQLILEKVRTRDTLSNRNFLWCFRENETQFVVIFLVVIIVQGIPTVPLAGHCYSFCMLSFLCAATCQASIVLRSINVTAQMISHASSEVLFTSLSQE
jgi:hypothetical protein